MYRLFYSKMFLHRAKIFFFSKILYIVILNVKTFRNLFRMSIYNDFEWIYNEFESESLYNESLEL